MKPACLVLRVYGEKSDGQWSLINLEFSLAAQAESLDEAKAILESQIKEYVYDALVGQDREHVALLMRRRAPFKYWVKYYIHSLRRLLTQNGGRHRAFKEALPMVPA